MATDSEKILRKPRARHPDKRLSAAAVRKLPKGRYADGSGLYLEVDESGARRWILRTVVRGRRRDIGLGGLSWVSLAEARDEAYRLRKIARSGGDPIAERDRERRSAVTFEEAARLVHQNQIVPTSKNGKHVAQWLSTLETYAFPGIGNRAISDVDQADVLKVLAPIWLEKPETARRVRQRLRTVLDWARTAGHREGVNPVEGVEKGLAKQRDKTRHFAALPWKDVPTLMKRLETVDGMGALALRFTILTAARSGETRGATWGEIDLDARLWLIPAKRMKAGLEHRVPLSDAALGVLRATQPLSSGPASLLFPSSRRSKPLSDMTLSAVLKRLDVPATVHGFRSSFRDWAEEETHFPREVKEAALAHAVKDKVEAAYRRTDLLEQRRQLMTIWAKFASGISVDL